MTSKREREHARSRQQKLQERQAAKAGGRRRSRTVNLVVGVVATLVVLGVVVAATFLGDGGDDSTQADGGTDSAQADGGADSTQADDACPPGVEPVAEAVQLDAVPPPASGTWTVSMSTTCGDVVLELDADAAPVGVGSFVGLTQAGFYDATPCHRLTTQGIFVLQCGDPTGTGTGGPGYSYGPVENAPADDVYPAGTVAMARVGGDGESMGSQFFLVYEESTIPSDAAGGYTVLGRITEGLQIVQLVAEGGLAGDGIAPARATGIISVTAEESA